MAALALARVRKKRAAQSHLSKRVVDEDQVRDPARDEIELLLGEAGAHAGDALRQPALVGHHDVRVTLHHDQPSRPGQRP